MIVIGVTGGFGTGKSTVSAVFGSLGAEVIDADKIAHGAIAKETTAYRKIVLQYGKGILKSDMEIDRRKLASLVFKSNSRVTALNAIVHPQVIRLIKLRVSKSKNDAIVIDAPLLIESGLHRLVDKLVVVRSSRTRQIERCIKKHDINRSECLNRIKCQLPIEKKVRMADYVVDNNGSKKDTKKQVVEIWRSLWK